MIRKIGPADLSDLFWIIDVAKRKYPPFDVGAAKAWGRAALEHPDIGVWTSDDCFAVAATYRRFYDPTKLFADLTFLCSSRDDRRSGRQLLDLCRVAKAWAVGKGCERLDFCAETLGVDLGPLARRLGSARRQVGYMLDLGAKGRSNGQGRV